MNRPDESGPTTTPGQQVPGVPSDNIDQLTVLARLAEEGFGGNLHTEDDGTLCCDTCGRCSAPETFADVSLRRMEGASDPDDMTAVVSARCPHCGTGGVVVLGYGPSSSASDAAVLVRLPDAQS